MRNKASVVFMTALLVVAALAFTAFAADGEIAVGLNAELTGSIPVVGQSSQRGGQIAVDEINAAGGLKVGDKTYTIRLIVEDNEDKAPSAYAATTKLITQHDVVAVIGPNASRNAIPGADSANNLNTPSISPWSTAVETTEDRPYAFRAAFIDDFQGEVVAKFARSVLNARTAAVLFDVASDYNKGIAEIFQARFQDMGGQIVSYETYTTGDKDFSSQLTKIRQQRPDVLFLPNYYDEVPLQVRQARQLGIQATILGSDSWGSEEIIGLGGNLMNGTYFSTHYSADIATPIAQNFISTYEQRFGSKPDDVAALTYDSFGLLFEALKRAGNVDRSDVREALASITDFEGVTGNMTFEGTGDPVKSAVFIKIDNGQFTYFNTVDP